MGLISAILRNGTDGRLTWWCPGCDAAHQVSTGDGPGPRWGWNGDAERPTFTPSVLVKGFKRLTDEQHAAWMAGAPLPERVPEVCHSFVGSSDGSTPGQMEFLRDCTHALAGKTVPIPPWPRPNWSDG